MIETFSRSLYWCDWDPFPFAGKCANDLGRDWAPNSLRGAVEAGYKSYFVDDYEVLVCPECRPRFESYYFGGTDAAN